MNNEITVTVGYVTKGEPLSLPNGNYKLVPIEAIPTPSANEGVGTIDTPEFWMLAQAWGNADQFKPRLEQAQKLITHIDQQMADARKAGFREGLARRLAGEAIREVALEDEIEDLKKKLAATPAPVSAAPADERAAFEASFLSWNGHHTKAELAAEWAPGTLAGEMFRAGYRASLPSAGAPEISGNTVQGGVTLRFNGKEVSAGAPVSGAEQALPPVICVTRNVTTTSECTVHFSRDVTNEELLQVNRVLRSELNNPDATPPADVQELPALMEVPREHTMHEDCNCEAVGYAKGWNTALATAMRQQQGKPKSVGAADAFGPDKVGCCGVTVTERCPGCPYAAKQAGKE